MTTQISGPRQETAAATPNTNKPTLVEPSDRIDEILQASPSLLPIAFASQHVDLLNASAIELDVARVAGVRSVLSCSDLPEPFRYLGAKAVPSLVFPWKRLDGSTVDQLRPDTPWSSKDGEDVKYVWPTDVVVPINVHDAMRPLVLDPLVPLAVVEGTKQYLAAVSALGNGGDFAAVGMAGCYGWSHGRKPKVDWDTIPVKGRGVYLLLDADLCTNRDVYDAARKLADYLKQQGAQVRYVMLPAAGKTGLDDVLAGFPVPGRGGHLRALLAAAVEDPGPRPDKHYPKFFGVNGLLVESLAGDIEASVPMLVGEDGYLYLYRDGYYQMGRDLILAEICDRLGEQYRPTHAKAAVEFLTAQRRAAGKTLPTGPDRGRLLNVRNGMLDLGSFQLLPHDPAYRSRVQLPVAWDPNAVAPTYERWLAEQAGDQAQDLEETIGTMLDPSRIPSKALFAYGPSRSGKSTLLRLMGALVGPANASALTLHQLAGNRFAAAMLHGKLLNCAADLSSHHVDDLAMFKSVTGGDPVFAENKNQQPFTFTNYALIAFSANDIPSVSESSKAYLERMKPFEFGRSFAGREDPGLETAMLTELPGILVRWVHALGELRQRGNPLPTRPNVAATFAQRSDRVRMFLDEMTVPDEVGTPRNALYIEFKVWTQANGSGAVLGRNKFIDRVRLADVEEYNHRTSGRSFRVKVIDPDMPPATAPDLAGLGTDIGAARGSCGSSAPTFATDGFGPVTQRSHTGESGTRTATTATVVFDLETADADKLYTYTPYDGQGFIRLAATDVGVSTDAKGLLIQLEQADEIIGHNVLAFDLLALARHQGADYRKLAGKTRDTLVLARLDDPPLSRRGPKADKAYDLDALAKKHLGVGKAVDLRALQGEYGGWDRIPLDHPDYLTYAARGIDLTRRLASRYPMTPYGAREHQVLAIAGQLCLQGFRVDEVALSQSQEAQRVRRLELTRQLPTREGLTTNKGKQQLAETFQSHGVELPRNARGVPLINRQVMGEVLCAQIADSSAGRLAALVRELNGQRSLLDQVHRNVVNGRVHTQISAGQATGRWSVTNPGLTTLRKRAGLAGERALFLPEDGEVILVADLSQIDARAVAAHCQDPGFMDLFGPGRDFHLEVAILVLGDPALRNTAKKLNHSVNYNVGARRLAEISGVSLAIAENYLAGMANRFPQWAAWKRETVECARSGQLLDNGFGRKLRVEPERAFTGAPAAIGQAAARDLLMEGLLHMDEAGLTPMLRAVIHDEVVLSVPSKDYDEVGRLVLDCLSFEWAPPGAYRLVAITAELGARPGSNWAEAY